MKMGAETSPLEIIRRHAIPIIGAMVGLGIIAALYYKTFSSNDDMITDATTSTTDVISDSTSIIKGSLGRVK